MVAVVASNLNMRNEGLEEPLRKEWLAEVSIRSRKPEGLKKPDKISVRDQLEEALL